MVKYNDLERYREQYISTLPPEELTTLLYNEIIKNLTKAINKIQENQVGEAHFPIIKAQDILLHLMSSLDLNVPVSSNLMSLYDYMYNTLISANVKKDAALLEQVKNMVKDLKDTWQQAIKISKSESYAIGQCV